MVFALSVFPLAMGSRGHVMSSSSSRERLVARLRRRMESSGTAYGAMTLIVLVSGIVAFFSSVVMLHMGIDQMSLRYPLAVGCAYVAFVGLVRSWLVSQRARQRRLVEDQGMTPAVIAG